MMVNYNKQLRFIVVLNFVATLRMISQQYQVPYWNNESFATGSNLALFGTLPNVLQCLLFTLISNSCC